jgi:two-component system, OmpR family, response regulator VicR
LQQGVKSRPAFFIGCKVAKCRQCLTLVIILSLSALALSKVCHQFNFRYYKTQGDHMADDVKRVVCIEDELEMIELVKLILSRHNFQVTGAVGGQQGLEKIADIKPDLVLLDLMMPEMDGWEVYQKMKASEEMRDIPVIVVTAKAQSIDRVLGLHIARVDDYITKPFGPQELLESVERVLSNR